MSYQILEDVALADVAVHAEADSLDAVFRDCAEAWIDIQFEAPISLEGKVSRAVRLEAAAPDLLLYKFMQELLYWKDAERLLLRVKRLATSVRAAGAPHWMSSSKATSLTLPFTVLKSTSKPPLCTTLRWITRRTDGPLASYSTFRG